MKHDPPPRRTIKGMPAAPPAPLREHEPNDDAADPESSDRPTLNPPFDLEAFARRSATAPLSPPPPPRPRVYPSDTPTARPPPGHEEALEADRPSPLPNMRAEQITLTNEVELERARAKSKQSEPPRSHTPSALSIANMRAPSVPSMPSVRSPSPASARSPSPTSIEAAVLGAIGSSGPEITERTIEDPIAEMRGRFSLGDYTGALEMAELLLAEDPSDEEAAECASSCRSVLESMYAARLGPLDRSPVVVVQRTQLRWLSMDHRAGFVLSLIDGSSTLETILDVCGMPRLDALRILQELVQQKIVALR